jgi:GNAT superfamily N-acetyltransferase
MSVDVTPVRGARQRKAFVDLPFRLHAGTPWIPPLKLERYAYLSRKLNPFFRHGEAEYFLARRDGRVVGRITAQIDRSFNDFHGERWGKFGFIEFEDDAEVLEALLAAARAWLTARGVERIVGPMDLEGLDEFGILFEGHELEPMIRHPWHPPYYRKRLEEAGLTKAMDVFHWQLYITDRDERMNPILPRLAERCETKYGIHIRKMTRRRLRRDLDEFAKVYNAAWSRNWGFVPLDEHDLDDMALNYQLIFAREWFMVAENDEGTVAVALTIPDINQVLKKMKGRLLPFGWWHYLNRQRIMDRCRIGFLGVLPEFQHTGVAAQLYMEHFRVASMGRVDKGEAGWILETNSSMNRGLEAMGGRITKRARIYDLPVS